MGLFFSMKIFCGFEVFRFPYLLRFRNFNQLSYWLFNTIPLYSFLLPLFYLFFLNSYFLLFDYVRFCYKRCIIHHKYRLKVKNNFERKELSRKKRVKSNFVFNIGMCAIICAERTIYFPFLCILSIKKKFESSVFYRDKNNACLSVIPKEFYAVRF